MKLRYNPFADFGAGGLDVTVGYTIDEMDAIIAPIDQELLMHNLSGFEDASAIALSTDSGDPPTITLTFTGTVAWWSEGVRYTATGTDSLQLADTTGLHYLYYVGDTLTATVAPTHAQIDFVIENYAIAAMVYWNATDNEAILIANELHGVQMSGATHHWIHDNVGARYKDGLTMSGYELDTATDAALTFEVSDGEFYDEDIEIEIEDGDPANQYEQQLNGGDASIPVLYRNAAGEWFQQAASTLPYIVSGTTLQYQDADNSYAQTSLSNNRFMNMFLVATNDWQYPIKMVQGTDEYTTQQLGQGAANTELVDFGNLPGAEWIILYQIILKGVTSGESVYAQIIDVIDFRYSGITGASASAQSHGSLSDLEEDDHKQYLLIDGTRAMTGNLDMGDNNVDNVGHIHFDLDYAGAHEEGLLHWNSEDGTLEIGMPGGEVNIQLGQEHAVRVRNETGVQIANGKVVYMSGSSGNKPLIALADADTTNLIPEAVVLGVTTEAIDHNDNGFVTLAGLVRDVNTVGMTAGDLLWLSTTPGAFTNVKPTAPNHGVSVGNVVDVGASGVILVRIVPVPGIMGLSGVLSASPSDGQLLAYVGGNSRWELTDALKITATGIYVSTLIDVGTEDTTAGVLKLFGGSTTNGGHLLIYNGANVDTTTDNWAIWSNTVGDFVITDDGYNTHFRIDEADYSVHVGVSGTVSLYYSGTETLVTTANGIEVKKDTASFAEIGYTRIGTSVAALPDFAHFSHIDRDSVSDYALIQNAAGMTILNASDGQSISFRIGNTETGQFLTGGVLYVGVEDTTEGTLVVSGGAASVGGSIQVENGADQDTTEDYYKIFANTTGGLTIEGGTTGNDILVHDQANSLSKFGFANTYFEADDTGNGFINMYLQGTQALGLSDYLGVVYVLSLGNNGVMRGAMQIYGSGATAGGFFNLWNGSDNDAVEVAWQHRANTDGTFQLAGATTGDIFLQCTPNAGVELFYNDVLAAETKSNGLSIPLGIATAGVDHTTAGDFRAYGGSGASGGVVRIYNGATVDSTEDHYYITASNGNLICKGATTADNIWLHVPNSGIRLYHNGAERMRTIDDGIELYAGMCLTLPEITTPTADANKGKLYTKTDNKLYFQDGAGTEHEIAFV